MKKRGQATIFVILAIVIVASIAGYFIVRGISGGSSDQEEFSDVFAYYEECISQYAQTGLSLAGMQGGWIDAGAYESGSNYAPFGNQLAVSGMPVKYWYTIEGNGVSKESVPTREMVEQQLNQYISDRLAGCSFDAFRQRGLAVSLSDANVKSTIAADGALIKVNSILSVQSENSSAMKEEFSLTVPSNFGALLTQAQEIYSHEQDTLFLENYTFDVLQLYAPVDGVEVQCSPKVWKAQDVFNDLQDGLAANLAMLKFNGDYYLKTAEKYYVVDLDVKGIDGAQVIYSKDWPARFEVYGNDNALLVAKPIGNEQGLSAVGFCYVPYHFVYDMMFPVLFRLSAGEDSFQFPVVVVIDKNSPRKAIQSSFTADYGDESDLCEASTQEISVEVRDNSGAVKNADVSYKCFDQSCSVGKTNSNGIAQGTVPACVNGQIEVESDNHAPASILFSSHNSSSTALHIDREYPVNVKLLVDGKESKDLAFISFVSETASKQAAIPDQTQASLSSGFYNVTVYQYGNTSIKIPASTSQQCLEVSAGGIAGIFGQTKEQCYDISIPASTLDTALTAGGQGEIYLPVELLEGGELKVSVKSLPKPTSMDSLQTNYALFETQGVDVIYG